jgi:hypothetical protein
VAARSLAELDPEDGCLWVYGVGEDGVIGFTNFGIECLRELIADLRATGRARRSSSQRSTNPAVFTGW